MKNYKYSEGTELFDWSCQSCGAHMGKHPCSEDMECVNMTCFSCDQEDTATGLESHELVKQAVDLLNSLGYQWDFEAADFVKPDDTTPKDK
jgi:hypothetical protein